MNRTNRPGTFLIAALLLTAGAPALLRSQCVNLAAVNSPYTQNFDGSLASAGTSGVVPAGWAFAEAGANANATYSAGTGSSNAGDTYSFGLTGSGERAFGGVLSGSLTPTVGACFVNNTGQAIARLAISYTGEQWRLGTLGRPDSLQFQYSTNATSLTSGAWTSVAALDFTAPVQGPAIGAIPGASTALSSSILNLNIPGGATFWIRWTDFNAAGADDGLAVDNFSLTPQGAVGLTVSDLVVPEGNGGVSAANVTVALAEPAPAGGVTFDIATADGSALADSDYAARSLTAQTIPAGETTYTFAVSINGDAAFEPDETFTVAVTNLTGAVGTKTTATVTIANDDIVPISAIQGFGSASPYAGQSVATSGIVTGLRSNGFFLQTPTGSDDGNPATSEGILVFTGGAPPSAATPGNLVRVSGIVTEFRPTADPASPPVTEITAPVVTLLSASASLPEPVLITPAMLLASGGLEQLERFEGMRVRVDSLTVTAPTAGNVSEANATSASNGVFYGVLTGTPRPFREPGIEEPDPVPAGAPCCVPRFDANPERIRVDSDAQPGAAALNVSTGAIVANLTGPLDYNFRAYTILPDPSPAPTIAAAGLTAVPVPAPLAGQFTVAAFNMERFFDTVNDAGISDVALTPAAFAGRLNKASLAIRNLLRSPDILAVEEVENLAALQAIATKINNDAAAAGEPNPAYTAFLSEGNDPGGIDVGFLVKSARVNTVSVTQEGAAATYTDPNTGLPALLNDRPPLVLRATVQPPSGAAFPITVIANHLRSLNGVDDPVDGNRVRSKRAAQAEFLASLVQQRQLASPAEAIVLVGDFNAFQFNDGLVDLIGTIRGAPASPLNVVKASPDLVTPDLADAADTVAAAQRYSYVFDGNAQTLDHVLITQNLLPRLASLAYLRGNADQPEILRGDFTRPERLSDHDAPVAYFSFPRADLGISLSAAPAPVTGLDVVYSIAVDNSLADTASGVQVSFPLPAQTTFVSYSAPAGWSCTTPAFGATAGTVTCLKTALGALSRETIAVTVKPACALANGSILSATATASSQTYDPDPSNNTRTIQTAVSNPPPVVSSPMADKPVLWPPNGKFEDVRISYTAADTCGGVTCVLTVSSNEPSNGRGDGNRSDDWEVVSPTLVRLRAERSGTGDGRLYTITVTCTDTAGNATVRTVTVSVPKSQGN